MDVVRNTLFMKVVLSKYFQSKEKHADGRIWKYATLGTIVSYIRCASPLSS
jgi:hypothetical protein